MEYRPAWLGLRRGAFTRVGWQCDPIWQVTLRSSVMGLHSIKRYTHLFYALGSSGGLASFDVFDCKLSIPIRHRSTAVSLTSYCARRAAQDVCRMEPLRQTAKRIGSAWAGGRLANGFREITKMLRDAVRWRDVIATHWNVVVAERRHQMLQCRPQHARLGGVVVSHNVFARQSHSRLHSIKCSGAM